MAEPRRLLRLAGQRLEPSRMADYAPFRLYTFGGRPGLTPQETADDQAAERFRAAASNGAGQCPRCRYRVTSRHHRTVCLPAQRGPGDAA